MATIDGEAARIIQAASDIDEAMRNSLPRRRYLFANAASEILIESRWDKDHVCGFPFRISLHQPDMEDAMDRAARERGAEVNQGWEVCSVEQIEGFATVVARERIMQGDGRSAWGRERTVHTKYVIGADGARSTVRESLRIERDSWPYRNAWLSFDSVRKRKLPNILDVSPDGQVAVIFCAPEGRAHSIIPLGADHIRFNLEVDPDGEHGDKLNDEFAYQFLKQVYGLSRNDVEVYRHAVYPFEGKLAKTWHIGRVFLAGDAAHLMTPFLGQGGCSALRDAINLAWKLDLVLRGLASETLLDSYELERKPHVRVHIDGSDKVAAMAFVANPAAAAARDRLYVSGETPRLPPEPILADGILYRSRRAAPVGDLAPQGFVRFGEEEGRFDDLAGWGFQLIGWRLDPAKHLTADQRQFFESIGGIVVGLAAQSEEGFAVDAGGAYERFFDQYGICALLMRPDFTIFGVAHSPDELALLVDDLRDQLNVATAPNRERRA